ncbi:MAG: hypothetical protein ACR2O4_09405, partial [Hyphomicrobiaceae bacterium]
LSLHAACHVILPSGGVPDAPWIAMFVHLQHYAKATGAWPPRINGVAVAGHFVPCGWNCVNRHLGRGGK